MPFQFSSLWKSLRQISNSALGDEVSELFIDPDMSSELAYEKSFIETLPSPPQSSVTATANENDPKLSKDRTIPCADYGEKLWEEQRKKWLTPTNNIKDISKRQRKNRLSNLDCGDDMHVEVYRNLVLRGRTLKKGISMTDTFNVINAGWEADDMYERVRKGGVP